MAIRLKTGAEVRPELVYNQVFLKSLKIDQVTTPTVGQTPNYSVTVVYCMYAIDDKGVIHYAPKTDTLHISDYFSMARAAAQDGDMNALQTFAAMQKTVAFLINKHLNVDTEIV